jgi:peptidoglycan hydrolase-like protein with peptidoglycan-binding domain
MADEPTLSKGQSSDWVVYLQQCLRAAGYWGGGDDGAFGDELEAAVVQFQSAYGLTADGVVGASTWAHLTGEANQSSSSSDSGGSSTPADQFYGLDPADYPGIMALVNSASWDDYVRNVVGVDPAIFTDDDPANVA